MTFRRQKIYLDHAAATPVDPLVWKAMRPFFEEEYGNPSALYARGRTAKAALQEAREKIAAILTSSPDEIIFTGSGTESDALALLGAMRRNARASSGSKKRGHLITTAVEHHAVLRNAQKLEREGFGVTFVSVDRKGLVSPGAVAEAMRHDTILVSVMYANNEIGTIQPIAEIGKMIKRFRVKQGTRTPFFHTDACQAAGYLDLDVEKLGVDLMTINGGKIYGPKGTGLLFLKRGTPIEPLWEGGGQENRLRSGTENIAGIAGLAEALRIVQERKAKERKRLGALRDYFIEELFRRIPKIVLNGHPKKRLPNNVNISFLDIEGEAMLLYLDRYGIEASTGSACDSATLDPSHVILALGRPYEFAHGSIRFSLGHATTKKDIDYVLNAAPGIVKKLRAISPVKIDVHAQEMPSRAAFAGEGLPHWERTRVAKVQ